MKQCEPLESRRLLAVTFLGDLNSTPSVFSTTFAPKELSTRGSTAIFSGFSLGTGREPWISDGTVAGTRMMIDLVPGEGSSDPSDFMTLANGFVFEAKSADGSLALFYTDGTAAGTHILLDAIPNSSADGYQSYYHSGSLLYFCVRMTSTSYDLWRTDGTIQGTFALRSLGNGFVVSRKTLAGLTHLSVQGGVGGTIVTDGTIAGTTRSNIAVGYGSWTTQTYMWDDLNALTRFSVGATSPLTVVYPWPSIDSRLIYAAGNSLVLRMYDSLYVGPESSIDLTTFRKVTGSTNFVAPNYIYNVGGNLFFTALPTGSTTEVLYVLDPVTRFAQVIATEINLNGGTPQMIASLGSKLIFSTTEANRTRLWSSDGTAAGTVPFVTVRALPGDASIDARSGDRLFFISNDGVTGRQLWISDGTAAGTVRLTSQQPTDSSSPRFVEVAPGRLVGAADSPNSGRELWLSEGTAAGTRMVEIAPGTTAGVRSPVELVNGRGYFVASNGSTGLWLWESDGTEANTRAVAQLETGVAGSYLLMAAGSRSVYVETRSGTTNTLRRYDTQTGITSVEHTQVSLSPTTPPAPTLWGDRLLFERFVGTTRSVFISSLLPGTSAPQALLAATASTVFLPFADEAALEKGRLYFGTLVGGQYRFWSTDGTPAGTAIASTFNLSSVSGFRGLTTANGAYFTITTFATNPPMELYYLNPTTGEVSALTNVTGAGVPSVPASLMIVNGRVVFIGYDAVTSTSRSLYVLNPGDTSATRLASVSASVPNAQKVGNVVFFTGSDGELWKSDLTIEGTALFYDFSPGGGSNPTVTPFARGGAFVSATHIAYGTEGWVIDDTFEPHVLSSSFDVDAATIRMRFDERMDEPGADAIAIVDTATGTLLASGFYELTAIATATQTELQIRVDSAVPNGNWRLTVFGGNVNGSIEDLAGNPLSSDATFDFYTLAGDANRDRVIDFADLLVVSQHYGQTGRSFSEGNFNYSADGAVTFDDLLILVQNYGATAIRKSDSTMRKRPNAEILS